MSPIPCRHIFASRTPSTMSSSASSHPHPTRSPLPHPFRVHSPSHIRQTTQVAVPFLPLRSTRITDRSYIRCRPSPHILHDSRKALRVVQPSVCRHAHTIAQLSLYPVLQAAAKAPWLRPLRAHVSS